MQEQHVSPKVIDDNKDLINNKWYYEIMVLYLKHVYDKLIIGPSWSTKDQRMQDHQAQVLKFTKLNTKSTKAKPQVGETFKTKL